MTYADSPNKRQLHPHYEHQTTKLDQKDNQFSSKKFHQIRKVSTHKKLLKSLGRIGMCLNDKPTTTFPIGDLDKVCFMLINDYENDKDYDLGVGPLNDANLIASRHHRLGFKVFYLYNPKCDEFTSFLPFFMKHTQNSLTVYYTGRCNIYDIHFRKGNVSISSINEIIAQNNTVKERVIFITDCIEGGSVFNIPHTNTESNMISLFVNKLYSPQSKEAKRSHGIFTYYFLKITNDTPNITPVRLMERMKPSLKRLNQAFCYDFTNEQLSNQPLFD